MCMCVWECVCCSERLNKRRSGKRKRKKKRFACSNVIAGLWSRLWFSCWAYKIFPNPSEIVSQEVKVQHWKCAQVCAYALLISPHLTAMCSVWCLLHFIDACFAECAHVSDTNEAHSHSRTPNPKCHLSRFRKIQAEIRKWPLLDDLFHCQLCSRRGLDDNNNQTTTTAAIL